ncbi:MAG: mechanosensitive ion channel family protein [Candidatus Theseobacter exili]|nr:mechanosensitive ion channel family protein [Candidatus Theseobacter exili]
MDNVTNFIRIVCLGNEIWKWGLFLVLSIVSFTVIKIVLNRVIKHVSVLAEKTKNDIDDAVVLILNNTSLLVIIVIAIFIGSNVLVLRDILPVLLWKLVIIAFFLQIALWGNALVSFWIERKHLPVEEDENKGKLSGYGVIIFLTRLLLWSVIVLLALSNLGVNITAAIASLGIGGIAVALAMQNILADLFCAVTIILDKPFEIGDFIIVDDLLGVIEKIGIKTTRIRSLHGEQLVFSNTDLTGSRVKNYKKMTERRVLFTFGVVYQTTAEKLERVPQMVKDIVKKVEQTRFDRTHFKEYGDSALVFEVVYYVLSADYNIYMDIQQKINMAIFRCFEKEKIEFAYPTQTLYVQNQTVS